MSKSVLNKLCKMILLSRLGQSCLDNSRLVPGTSQSVFFRYQPGNTVIDSEEKKFRKIVSKAPHASTS